MALTILPKAKKKINILWTSLWVSQPVNQASVSKQREMWIGADYTAPAQPIVQQPRQTAIGTGVSYEKKAPTLATRDNPIIAVSTKPAPVDINTADMSTLLKEQDAINFKIANNSFTQDDYVRGREISRKLAEQMYKVPEATANPYVSELEAKAQELKSRDYTPELTARKQQLEANFNIRKNQLEENARRARESTIGNIAMAGGWRSSVAQQAELDIQRQLADQISAEQSAMQQEILAYQRQLEGASDEELSGIYDTIDQLKAQSSQWQQALQQQAFAKQQEAISQFDTNLQNLARINGIELDANDEKAVEQMVQIARNADWSVNEAFLKTLAPQYQELVRSWVNAGIWSNQGVKFTPKVERIGGTSKYPVYGYRDPNKQAFVNTNAQGVPTVKTGGGGSYFGGGAWEAGWATTTTTTPTEWSKYYNEDNGMLYMNFINSGGKTRPTEKQMAQLWGIDNFNKDATSYFKKQVESAISWGGVLKVTNIKPYLNIDAEQRKTISKDADTMSDLITSFDNVINQAKTANRRDLTNKYVWGGRTLSNIITSSIIGQKERYKLWALTWPDMDILTAELPQPWAITSINGKTAFVNAYISARNRAIQEFNNRNSWKWVQLSYWLMSPISWEKGSSNAPQQSTTPWVSTPKPSTSSLADFIRSRKKK